MSSHFIGKMLSEQLTLDIKVDKAPVKQVATTSKRFRAYKPNETVVVMQVPKNILPSDHMAFYVMELVKHLDLSEIFAKYNTRDGRGRPPYDPLLMTTLLTYCYMTRCQSSRKMEEATFDVLPCRIITGDQHPDHDTINDFRKRHLPALSGLFEQSVQLAMKHGLISLEHVANDGSKFKANASKHKAMSYDRMCQTIEKYEKEIPILRSQIEKAYNGAIQVTRRELKELQKDLKIREERLPKIKSTKAELEEEMRKQAARKKAEKEEEKEKQEKKNQEKAEKRKTKKEEQASKQKKKQPGKKAKHKKTGKKSTNKQERSAKQNKDKKPTKTENGKKAKRARTPEEKAQRNFTDPDSKIMPWKKTFEQCYNAQIAVDSHRQIIVGNYVTQSTNDKKDLIPMVSQLSRRFNRLPDNWSADAGFFSVANLTHKVWNKLGITNLHIPPKKEDKGRKPAARVGRMPKNITEAEKMVRKLNTTAGKAIYSKRKAIVEPVLGQVKRTLDFDEFSFRGLKPVNQEFGFVCGIHNFKKLYTNEIDLAATG